MPYDPNAFTHASSERNRFLGSEFVELRTSSTAESWKIHKKLLEAKCKAVGSAFSHQTKENASGKFTFEETTHDTIARFIEWAYRGDYTAVSSLSAEKAQLKKKPQVSNTQAAGVNDITTRNELTNTLLYHLKVYVFSDTYLVAELKELAFQKFTTAVKQLGQPKNIDEQLAIINCLSLAFTTLPPPDLLLAWLAQFAAWSLDILRLESKFLELLQDFPSLGCRMMDYLRPADNAPW